MIMPISTDMKTKMKIDIKPEQFKIVQSILKKHLSEDTKVFVFGSRAKNCARMFSDLDLLLHAKKPLSMQLMADLAFDFEESDLPWTVDLVDWMCASDAFRNNMASQYVEIEFD